MTRNQIEYLKHIESQRSNRAVEAETNRANLEREAQGRTQLGETQRHNLATERTQLAQVIELGRHNQAQEALGQAQLQETRRSNTVREQQTAQQIQLGRAQLNETTRANRARESIQLGSLQEQVRANQAAESEIKRANLAREAETARANQAREQETHRSNVVNEGVQIGLAATRAGELAERVRSDLARETETALHNRAMELKDMSPRITYNAGNTPVSVTVPTGTNNTSTVVRPSTNVKAPTTQTPTLVGRTVEPGPSEGIINNLTGLFTGNKTNYVTERYSDGSQKYYMEVLKGGQITERKEISASEFARKRKGVK